MAINPAITGHKTQVPKIVISTFIFVADPVYKFHPTMAPTIACVVETGNPTLVIRYTDNPAATHAAKAPGNALIAFVQLFNKWVTNNDATLHYK